MKKKCTAIFVVCMIIASFFCFSQKTFAANASIKVQFFNTNTSSSTNSIGLNYKVTNTSSSSLDLSTITLRYYYTKDGNQDQTFWCDYSNASGNTTTDKVTSKFVKMDSTTNEADSYLELGFKSDAGSLAPGESAMIQGRVTKSDWSSYDQTNDYSFNKDSSGYSDWNKVTGYVDGTLNYGEEPINSTPSNSTIAPTSATFNKNVDKQSDISVTLTLNGNTLKSIVNGSSILTQDKDYTLSDNVVTLNKDYLATLSEGNYNLVFNFSAGEAATFSLKVINTPVTVSTNISIGKITGKPGDTVIVPVTLSKIPSGGLDGFTFNVTYDSTLLELVAVKPGSNVADPDSNFSYTALEDNKTVKVIAVNLSAEAGTNVIAKDGDVCYISFKIKDSAAPGTTSLTLSDVQIGDTNGNIIEAAKNDGSITIEGTTISAGKIEGKVGDTVVIPVTLSAIPKQGLNGCVFNVTYDSSALDLVGVKAGSNVVDPDLNFSYETLSSGLRVIVVNLSEEAGTNAIKSDGDAFYISFKIKDTASAGVIPITLGNVSLGDVNGEEVTTTSFDGSIDVVTK